MSPSRALYEFLRRRYTPKCKCERRDVGSIGFVFQQEAEADNRSG